VSWLEERRDLIEWSAAHLVAAGVPLTKSAIYNVYRLALIHEDTLVLERDASQEYVRPDLKLRSSLLVLDGYDFPHVEHYGDALERLAERVGSAAAELRLSPERREAIAVAADDSLLGAERAARELDIYEGAAWVRKHLWPRLQLYRRENRSNPGWTYLARRSELERLARELRAGQASSEEEREARQAWTGLNARQQDYLVAAYRLQHARPRAWIRYGLDDEGFHTELYRAIQRERARDPGTGSTWNALESRGLVECRYVMPPGFDESQLEVRLTRRGHVAGKLGQDEAERRLRERQHELLNDLERVYKNRIDWSTSLHRLRAVLAATVPEDLTPEARRLLADGIEPGVLQIGEDLGVIRQALERLQEAAADPPTAGGDRGRRRRRPSTAS
jgi:hypothetical protein